MQQIAIILELALYIWTWLILDFPWIWEIASKPSSISITGYFIFPHTPDFFYKVCVIGPWLRQSWNFKDMKKTKLTLTSLSFHYILLVKGILQHRFGIALPPFKEYRTLDMKEPSLRLYMSSVQPFFGLAMSPIIDWNEWYHIFYWLQHFQESLFTDSYSWESLL